MGKRCATILKQILLFSSLFFYLPSFAQTNPEFYFEEKQTDSLHQPPDSILIIGSGDVSTRIFLDDLSTHITKKLKDKGVSCLYYFIEKTNIEAKAEIDLLKKNGYKALLFLLPKAEAFYDFWGGMQEFSANQTPIGSLRILTPLSGVSFKQHFSFRLAAIHDTGVTEIWMASVDVNADLTKSRFAKKVGDKMLSCFRKLGYTK